MLDSVDDDGYHLTESINDGIFLLMSVSNKNKERQPAVRIIGYAEQVVPSYTDSVFRCHFRLSRQSAETVTRLLGACPGIPTVHRRGRPPVIVEKKITFNSRWSSTFLLRSLNSSLLISSIIIIIIIIVSS